MHKVELIICTTIVWTQSCNDHSDPNSVFTFSSLALYLLFDFRF